MKTLIANNSDKVFAKRMSQLKPVLRSLSRLYMS